jgi:hypothetical protein
MRTTIAAFVLCLVFSCNSGVSVDKSLNGKTLDFAIEKYGKPQAEMWIMLTKESHLYEYQYNLINLFPNLSSADTLMILQESWNRKGKHTVLWFQQKDGEWVVIDNLTHGDEVKF